MSDSGIRKFLTAVVELNTFPVFILYLLMVTFAGLWRKLARVVEIRSILVIYNFVCSTLSLYTCIMFAYGTWKSKSLFALESTTTLKSPFYWYMISKRLELLDTVFMILRHRERQLSFLHVYHHSSMLLLSEYGNFYTPWPAIGVYACLNSFVHVVLYLYYGLCAAGYSPPWKKQMTQIQILQFVIGFFFALNGYFYHKFCVYSIFYGLSMTILFSNFYYAAYHKKKKVN